MYYLSDLKHFVSIFHWFLIQLTPFSINFKFFDPSFLQKLRSDWVHFFSRVLYPGTKNLMKYPPLGHSSTQEYVSAIWVYHYMCIPVFMFLIVFKHILFLLLLELVFHVSPSHSHSSWNSYSTFSLFVHIQLGTLIPCFPFSFPLILELLFHVSPSHFHSCWNFFSMLPLLIPTYLGTFIPCFPFSFSLILELLFHVSLFQ